MKFNIVKMFFFIVVVIGFSWMKNNQKKAGKAEEVVSPKSVSWVLALSWSPEFCYEKDREKKQHQCQVPRGFVVHGLWPEQDSTHCLNENEIPSTAIDLGKEVFPSLGLMRHEWKKHGACSGLNANEYFSKARDLFYKTKLNDFSYADSKSVKISDFLSLLQKKLPSLKREYIVFQCKRRYLKELRICLDDNFSFQNCPSRLTSSCNEEEFFLRN